MERLLITHLVLVSLYQAMATSLQLVPFIMMAKDLILKAFVCTPIWMMNGIEMVMTLSERLLMTKQFSASLYQAMATT